MADPTLLNLAQDLEWLGCELEFCGHKHAMEGFPGSGPTWETFLQKQRGVLATADKIERELKGSIRFNPSRLVGLDYPMHEALESVAQLLAAVEDIKHCAEFGVGELPSKVRNFTRMVDNYLGTERAVAR